MTVESMHRRALVTGGAGFLGARLVRVLCARGWQVTLLVRPTTVLPEFPSRTAVLVDDGGMDGLLAGIGQAAPDVVFHLATRFQAAHAPEDVEPLLRDNVLFPARLLEALADTDCRRVVNAGTLWQAPAGPGSAPVNLYAATKQAFADLLAYYVAAQGFTSLTLTLSDTYGPHDPRGKLFAQLRSAARRQETLPMSPGGQLLDLVHAEDAVAAFLAAADRILSPGFTGAESWAVTSGQLHPLREVVELYRRLNGGLPRVAWGARSYRPQEVMVPVPGPPLPGWQPRIGLEDGLRALLASEDSPLEGPAS